MHTSNYLTCPFEHTLIFVIYITKHYIIFIITKILLVIFADFEMIR